MSQNSIQNRILEEREILHKLADLLLEERLLTAEEWMRLRQRIEGE